MGDIGYMSNSGVDSAGSQQDRSSQGLTGLAGGSSQLSHCLASLLDLELLKTFGNGRGD